MARFRDAARITLLSNDSDLLQFVADGVVVATYVGAGKGPEGTRIRPWSADDVHARFGVTPEQLPAFKALAGESGDDIPGVPGIGKGVAATLLRRWKTITQALEATQFVSHRDATAKLAGQAEHVQLMLQLTTIRQDAPLPALALDGVRDRRRGVARWLHGARGGGGTPRVGGAGAGRGAVSGGVKRRAGGSPPRCGCLCVACGPFILDTSCHNKQGRRRSACSCARVSGLESPRMLFRQYFEPKLAQYAYLVGCQKTVRRS